MPPEVEFFASEAEAVQRLDRLREQREAAKRAEQLLLDEIKAVLAQAGRQPFDRSTLIAHSGLSRRTAYQVLPPRPEDDP